MIHQKQIEKFENSLYREKIGFDLKTKSWYEEDFQKSANEYYGLGRIYFIKCGKKYVGKCVSQLIKKLKSNSTYIKNKAFKHSVNDLISSDLLTDLTDTSFDGYTFYDNSYYYVDENNLVQELSENINGSYYNKEYFKEKYLQYCSIASTIYELRFLKNETRVLEYYHSTFKYIIRFKGLHYYVTNETLDYLDLTCKYAPRLTATHQVVINNALSELQLLKLSVSDLKYHGLIDIKENI